MSCPKCRTTLTSVMYTRNGSIEPLPYFVVCPKCKKVYGVKLIDVYEFEKDYKLLKKRGKINGK